MIYCSTCAEKYKLSDDAYFACGLAQCEICGGGKAPHYQKWIGIRKIAEIATQLKSCHVLSETKLTEFLDKKIKQNKQRLKGGGHGVGYVLQAALEEAIDTYKLVRAFIGARRFN